jgi:hypothetical protein
MDRQFLVQEIKRLANEDSGTPPGQEKFPRETGVPPAQWRGVYWAKWSDALAEAGFKPNSFNVAYEQDFLLEQLATAARDLQKFPTTAELKLYARGKAGFPTKTTFESRFKKRIRALNNFCERHTDWSDVLNICRSFTEPERKTGDTEKPSKLVIKGHVYLMRSGNITRLANRSTLADANIKLG